MAAVMRSAALAMGRRSYGCSGLSAGAVLPPLRHAYGSGSSAAPPPFRHHKIRSLSGGAKSGSETTNEKFIAQAVELVKTMTRNQEMSGLKQLTGRVDKLEAKVSVLYKSYGMAVGVFAIPLAVAACTLVCSLQSDLGRVKEDLKKPDPDVVILQHRVNWLENLLLPNAGSVAPDNPTGYVSADEPENVPSTPQA